MIFANSHLVRADHICDDQTTYWAVRDHLGAPSAKHEMPTWIENHVDVLRPAITRLVKPRQNTVAYDTEGYYKVLIYYIIFVPPTNQADFRNKRDGNGIQGALS
jgi:hypothetical protein